MCIREFRLIERDLTTPTIRSSSIDVGGRKATGCTCQTRRCGGVAGISRPGLDHGLEQLRHFRSRMGVAGRCGDRHALLQHVARRLVLAFLAEHLRLLEIGVAILSIGGEGLVEPGDGVIDLPGLGVLQRDAVGEKRVARVGDVQFLKLGESGEHEGMIGGRGRSRERLGSRGE